MVTNQELNPKFLITLELDGDDYAVTSSWEAETILIKALEGIKSESPIVGYTLEKVA